jgi:hypothetical protein
VPLSNIAIRHLALLSRIAAANIGLDSNSHRCPSVGRLRISLGTTREPTALGKRHCQPKPFLVPMMQKISDSLT